MKNRLGRFLLLLIVVAVFASILSACTTGHYVTVSTYDDRTSAFLQPQCTPAINPPNWQGNCILDNNEGGPFPAIMAGQANSCRDIPTTISNQNTLCRVVHGLNDGGSCGAPCKDHTNYELVSDQPLQMSEIDPAHPGFGYGEQVADQYTGQIFEGCQQIVWGNAWGALCDVMISNEKVSNRSNQVGAYYLNALWGMKSDAASGLCAVGLIMAPEWGSKEASLCLAGLALS